ncbi:MAG: hypothetical protein ACHP8A_06900 [Terriglobales bacterium]
MTKWTPNRRDPGRTYVDEEIALRQSRMLARIRELAESGSKAKPEVVAAAKAADPNITPEKLKEIIMLFREAVYDRQQHDLRHR